MNILLASSEVAPLAKTGGLADVAGALPRALARLGHEVAIVMPAYRQAKQCGLPIEFLNLRFDIPIGHKIVRGQLLRTYLPGGEVPVYLVEQDDYFDRTELYGERGEAYKDNCERFVFFSRAALEIIRMLRLGIEVVHCNDWQTGLIPALLETEYLHASSYERVGSLMTIHNLAYQGLFWHWDMALTGLDWKYFNLHQMEFYGQLNLLKTGLVFADAISTVSHTYAQEIQTPEQGCGLEGLLQGRANVLHGITNGVDYDIWNPATDGRIAQKYDATNWQQGKAACKAALQREFKLPESGCPIFGFVGRLVEQKGWDLLAELMPRWLREEDVQWVVLGTGDPKFEEFIRQLAAEYPYRLSARLQFSEALAHQVEAGSDMFLMPSRFEPCGLNQLYSLKYGAVPVVRATGGLADTVRDLTPESMDAGNATGFSFEHYHVAELEWALRRALDTYRNRPDLWRQVVENGMKQDWSWSRSAHEYEALYRQVAQHKLEAWKRRVELGAQ